MRPLAILAGLWAIRTLAMHTDTFLQAFNRLGLAQWDGIEQDIAWGHVTSLMGLSRPSIDGPIFIYRAPCLFGGLSPHRVRLVATTSSGPEPLLAEIASQFEDLADPVQFEPWRLLTIDTSRGRSRNRELHHPCYILVTSVPIAPLAFAHMESSRWFWGRKNSPFPLSFPWQLMWSCLETSLLP